MLSNNISYTRSPLCGNRDAVIDITKFNVESIIAKTNNANIMPHHLLKFLNRYIAQAQARPKDKIFSPETIEEMLRSISRSLDEITKNHPDKKNDIIVALTKLEALCPQSLFQPQSSQASINTLKTVESMDIEPNWEGIQYFQPSKVQRVNLNTGFSSRDIDSSLALLSSSLSIKEKSVEKKPTTTNSSKQKPIVGKILQNRALTAKTNFDGAKITDRTLLINEMEANTSFRSANLSRVTITGKVFSSDEEKTFINNSNSVLQPICYGLDLASITFKDLALTFMRLVSADFNKLQGEDCRLTDLIIQDSIMSNMLINTSFWQDVQLIKTQFTNTLLDNAKIKDLFVNQVNMSSLVINNSSFLGNSSINSSVMNKAVFKNVIFEGVDILDTKLLRAQISGTKIDDSDYTSKFRLCRLRNVVFRSSNWSNTVFINVSMNNLDFASSSFQNVEFISKADFEHDDEFDRVNFSHCKMDHIYCEGFEMDHFDFSYAKLDDITAEGSLSSKCSFEFSTIKGSSFFDTYFKKCNFSNATISESNLDNSVFSSCTLGGLIIENNESTQDIIFTNYEYNGTGLDPGHYTEDKKTNFINVGFNPGQQNITFRNCDLTNSLFYQIGLSGIIDNCDLTNVEISDCTWCDLKISNCHIGMSAKFENVKFISLIFNNNQMTDVHIKKVEFIGVKWKKLTIPNPLFEGLITFKNGVIIDDTTIINGDFNLAKIVMSNSSVKKLTFLYDESQESEVGAPCCENFDGQINCSDMNEIHLEFRDLEVNGKIIIINSPAELIFSGTTTITGSIIIKSSANVTVKLLDKAKLAGSVKYLYSKVVQCISHEADISELKLTNIKSEIYTIPV